MPSQGDKTGGVKRVARPGKKRPVRKADVEQAPMEHGAAASPLDTGAQKEAGKSIWSMNITGPSVRREDVNMALRQLIMLLEAGTPLLRSLQTLADRAENPGVRGLMQDIATHVENGNALWQAFERHPRLFDSVFVSLVQASEASGTLVEVLRRQIEYRERAEMLSKRVKRAMYYPVILVVFAAAVVCLLAWVVVPEFEKLFQQIGGGKQLPGLTLAFMGTVKFVTSGKFIILALVVLVALWLLFRWWVANPLNRLMVDHLKLRIPKIGPGIIRKNAVVQMCRSIALLLRSGISMMQTLDLSRGAIHNQAFVNVLQRVRDSVERGEGIEQPLREARGVIPPVVADMLVTGEESGQLDQIAEHIAETYDEEVSLALESLGDMIQPVLTVFVGGLVLFAALAFFVPIIGMIQEIGSSGI